MTSPPVPQEPKQCQVCRSGVTMKDGVFSAWNGQRPFSVRPALCSRTYWPTTSAMSRRAFTSSISLMRQATFYNHEGTGGQLWGGPPLADTSLHSVEQ